MKGACVRLYTLCMTLKHAFDNIIATEHLPRQNAANQSESVGHAYLRRKAVNPNPHNAGGRQNKRGDGYGIQRLEHSAGIQGESSVRDASSCNAEHDRSAPAVETEIVAGCVCEERSK